MVEKKRALAMTTPVGGERGGRYMEYGDVKGDLELMIKQVVLLKKWKGGRAEGRTRLIGYAIIFLWGFR